MKKSMIAAAMAIAVVTTGCMEDDPNKRAKIGAAIGAVTGAVIGNNVGDGDTKDRVVGAVVGAGLPILVILIYKLWRGIEGMGWGDVKYLAAIGAVVGARGVVGVLVVASVVGALFGLGLIAAGRGSGKTALPFGTFLALAVIFWLYAPASWLAWSPL